VNGPDGEACPNISADGSILHFFCFGDWDLWQVPILLPEHDIDVKGHLNSDIGKEVMPEETH
jgi:hypothetical protein